MTSAGSGKDGDVKPSERAARVTESARDCLVVVDDDGIIREMLRASLESRYKVVCLPNGRDVIRTIDESHPRLLILDVNIPGGDGFEICESVREHARFQKLPILFMTARKDDTAFLKGLESGGNALIMKPFEIGELRARVGSLLAAYPPS